MTTVSWIHLSDWHQKGKEFDRKIVRDALLRDIEQRHKISPELANIDFVIFSGDITHSGKREEYQTAISEFFNPILNVVGVPTNQLIIVPGNHDVEWSAFDLLPNDLLDRLDSSGKVTEWLTDKRRRHALLEPMANYSEFVNKYIGEDTIFEPAYGYERLFEIRNKKIGVIGLNSAWLSGRNKENRKGASVVNDYGHLILGEAQVYDLIKSPIFSQSDLKIIVLHHPFDWLADFDKQIVRDRIRKSCHFILHGHEHQPEIRTEFGTGGNCITIPAGASYDRREPEIARYANAYNYVHLNIETGKGRVYLRRYEDRQGWIKDSGTTGDSKPGLWSFSLSKQKKKSHTQVSTQIKEKLLPEKLDRILRLYLATSYDREQYAKLDQAGEADPDRTTLLHQIFVDLEVSQYSETHPKDINKPLVSIDKKEKSGLELREVDGKKIFSVMQCLLQEVYPMNVIIGGPGQGKSTVTQFISQIQRSTYLGMGTNKIDSDIPLNDLVDSKFSPKVLSNNKLNSVMCHAV